MEKIPELMKTYGATNFQYVEVHRAADGIEDGHGATFLEALEQEKPLPEEVENGMKLFENFYLNIFK